MGDGVKRGVLRRSLHNAGVLLGGKVAAGIMQLATFALAARALGLENFGNFSVMLAQIQLLITLATFQSNQAIVRYGVMHLQAGDRRAFQAMVRFGVLVDLIAAAVAVVAALLIGEWLFARAGWNAELMSSARLLALLPLTLALATPKGVLRLFGRFDLLSQHTIVTPLARLAGAVAVTVVDGGLLGFVVTWLVAGILGVIAAAAMAWRELARRDLARGLKVSLRGLRSKNPGILRFVLASNLHSSLNLVPAHLSTFAAGMVLGPTAGGLMKVAQELGTAFARPIDLMNQTIYPELARLTAEGSFRRARKLIFRSGVAAAALSLAITVLLFFTGEWLIRLVFGPEFAPSQDLLLLVAVATTLTVSVFAVEPTLYALGRPSLALAAGVVSCTLFIATLFASFPMLGLYAPGAAYIAGAAGTFVVSLWLLRRALPAA